MKYSTLLTLTLSVAALSATAADTALLAIPGKVIYENKLDTAPAAPWASAKGKWELVEGALRGAEKPEDKHGAVTRLPNKLTDFVIDYEFKFEGARSTSLSINAVKDHMARIMITPKTVTIQRDDNDHDGPDKAIIFARFPADLAAGTWHKVHLEMVGDTLVGQVDNLIAYGTSDLFKTPKMAAGFTVGGQSVDFRNFSLREATLNPAWDSVKATLPAPGSKIAPPPAPGAAGGKGKGNGKGKAQPKPAAA
jgi:hypothetical protein